MLIMLIDDKVGALVRAGTNASDIDFGQTCALDTAGVMGDATGSPDKSGKFYVSNSYGKICLGVNGKLNGTLSPIFVSPTAVIGSASFEPIECVQVWFSASQVTGTMIFDADSEAIQIKYHGKTTDKSVTYKNGRWVAV